MLRPKTLLFLVDVLLACGCLLFSFPLRFFSLESADFLWQDNWLTIFVYVSVVVFYSYFFELYELQKFQNEKWLLYRCGFVFAVAILTFSIVFYLFPSIQLGRGVLVISLGLFYFCQAAIRFLIRKFSRSSQFATRILIAGTGELAKTIAGIIPPDNNDHSYVRFISCTKKEPVVDQRLIVGHIAEIKEIIQDYRPQKLIVALAERRGSIPLRELMQIKLRGVDILEATTFYEQKTGRLLVENIQPSSFVYTQRFRMTPFLRSYKRLYDIIFSVIGLTFSAPLFPVLALWIKLDSPGSVFFKQLRTGENEVEYFIYKFRTMAQDAESTTGAVWAQKDDPRVTRVGRLLRKTRLDEIPQLYNVLKGDMSFVGPRPERMAFVERLKETIPFYSTRHFVKPGVTGWAQVRYPYGATDEDALEKLRYDLYYIKNYSIFLDFRIVIDTIRVVLTGFGGR